jgi:hypothetical protein
MQKKTPLKPEEAKRDEKHFKRQKIRQLQQAYNEPRKQLPQWANIFIKNIEIAAEYQHRRYHQISNHSEYLNMPQDRQEEFKNNIKKLLRDKLLWIPFLSSRSRSQA